jgi:hypothetical protein
MLYPSGMVVARPAANGTGALSYTKHYFAGAQRVSSKIGTTTNLGQFEYTSRFKFSKQNELFKMVFVL